MAMTETRPETSDPIAGDPAPVADVEAVLGTGDHKTIGRAWIAVSALFAAASLIVLTIAGIERIDPGSFDLLDDVEMYAQLWSLGREGLLMLSVVPLLIGLATYVVPLQVGASTVAFPRGAAAAFWVWVVSAVLVVAAYVGNGGVAGGRQDFTLLWAAAYGGVLVGLIWALVCVLTTILGLRTLGMTLDRAPVWTWAFLVFGTIGLLNLAAMAAELVASYIRIRYGDLDAAAPRLALQGVTDQISLAPAVFWLAIPVLGLAAEGLPAHAESPLGARHRVAMGLLGALGLVSFAAHHLAFIELRASNPLDNGVLVVQVLLLPLLVVGLLGVAANSLRSGRFVLRTPVFAGLVGGGLVLLACLVAVLVQVEHILTFIDDVFAVDIDVPTWLQLSGTTAHDGVRTLVVGAALVAAVGGLGHWAHKIYGRGLAEGLGLLAVAALAGGAAVWGIADVASGMLEQAREPLLSSEVRNGVDVLNAVATGGAGLMALGAVLVLVNLGVSVLAGRGSRTEPWRGLTLEWATPSPPPPGNFPEPPVVRSATPLADRPLEEEQR